MAETKPRRAFHELRPAQQAAIRCQEPAFQEWVRSFRPQDWPNTDAPAKDKAAEAVRRFCCIESRAQLDRDTLAADCWHHLHQGFVDHQLGRH